MKEIPEHEFVHILVELIGEEFVQAKTRSRLFSIHPGVGLFCLVAKRGPDLSPHPLECIVILDCEPN